MNLTSTPAFPLTANACAVSSLMKFAKSTRAGANRDSPSSILSRLGGYLDWPGVAQTIRIERTRIIGDQRVTEVSHAITSFGPDRANAKHLLDLNRGLWGIENRLHWVRDVTMGEDKYRARTGYGPVNLACLRNASLLSRFKK